MINEFSSGNDYALTIVDETTNCSITTEFNLSGGLEEAKRHGFDDVHRKPIYVAVKFDDEDFGSMTQLSLREAEILANGLLKMVRMLEKVGA